MKSFALLWLSALFCLAAPACAGGEAGGPSEDNIRAERVAEEGPLPRGAYLTSDERACGLSDRDVVVSADSGVVAISPDRADVDGLVSCLIERRRFSAVLIYSFTLESRGRAREAYSLARRVAAKILDGDPRNFAQLQVPSNPPDEPALWDAARLAARLHARRDFDLPRQDLPVWRAIETRH